MWFQNDDEQLVTTQEHTDSLNIEGLVYHGAFHGTMYAGVPGATVLGTPTHRAVIEENGDAWLERIDDGDQWHDNPYRR